MHPHLSLSSHVLTAFVASILVWSEKERLHLNETADRVILFIHVSVAAWTLYHYTSFLTRKTLASYPGSCLPPSTWV